MNNENLIDYFFLKNLNLEQSLVNLQTNGIDIGYNSQKSNGIIDIDLFPFKIWIKAEKMAEFYKIYFTLENSIRDMIKTVLQEKYGSDWLKHIPKKVLDGMNKFRKEEMESGMEISNDILEYAYFGDLITILESNERDFDNIGDLKKAKPILSSFNKSRNVVAHSRMLTQDEISRFLVLVKTWLRMSS